MALTIIGDVVSPRERGRYQGYFGAVFGLSSIAGPLLGRLVRRQSQLALGVLHPPAARLVALFVTATVLNIPFHRRDHKIDYPGAGLLVGGVSSLLLVTVWGGREYEWGSPSYLFGRCRPGVDRLFLWWEVRTLSQSFPTSLPRTDLRPHLGRRFGSLGDVRRDHLPATVPPNRCGCQRHQL